MGSSVIHSWQATCLRLMIEATYAADMVPNVTAQEVARIRLDIC